MQLSAERLTRWIFPLLGGSVVGSGSGVEVMDAVQILGPLEMGQRLVPLGNSRPVGGR